MCKNIVSFDNAESKQSYDHSKQPYNARLWKSDTFPAISMKILSCCATAPLKYLDVEAQVCNRQNGAPAAYPQLLIANYIS